MLRNREMNMTEGPLLKKIILYALPLIATNVLQMLFHSADIFTLRFFAGEGPVAAVGGTAALIGNIPKRRTAKIRATEEKIRNNSIFFLTRRSL